MDSGSGMKECLRKSSWLVWKPFHSTFQNLLSLSPCPYLLLPLTTTLGFFLDWAPSLLFIPTSWFNPTFTLFILSASHLMYTISTLAYDSKIAGKMRTSFLFFKTKLQVSRNEWKLTLFQFILSALLELPPTMSDHGMVPLANIPMPCLQNYSHGP